MTTPNNVSSSAEIDAAERAERAAQNAAFDEQQKAAQEFAQAYESDKPGGGFTAAQLADYARRGVTPDALAQASAEAAAAQTALAGRLAAREITLDAAAAELGAETAEAAAVEAIQAQQETAAGQADQRRVDAEAKLESAGLLTRDEAGNVVGVDAARAVRTPGIGEGPLIDLGFSDDQIGQAKRQSAAQVRLERPAYQAVTADGQTVVSPALAVAQGANPLLLVEAGYAAPETAQALSDLKAARLLTPAGEVDIAEANRLGQLETVRAAGVPDETIAGVLFQRQAAEVEAAQAQADFAAQQAQAQADYEARLGQLEPYRDAEGYRLHEAVRALPEEFLSEFFSREDIEQARRDSAALMQPVPPPVQGFGPEPEFTRGELEFEASQTPQAVALRQLAPYAAPEGGYYLDQAARDLPAAVLIDARFDAEQVDAALERNAQSDALAAQEARREALAETPTIAPETTAVGRFGRVPTPLPVPVALSPYLTSPTDVDLARASADGLNALLIESGLLTPDKAQAEQGRGLYLPTAQELREKGTLPTYVSEILQGEALISPQAVNWALSLKKLDGVVYRIGPNDDVFIDSTQDETYKAALKRQLRDSAFALGYAYLPGISGVADLALNWRKTGPVGRAVNIALTATPLALRGPGIAAAARGAGLSPTGERIAGALSRGAPSAAQRPLARAVGAIGDIVTAEFKPALDIAIDARQFARPVTAITDIFHPKAVPLSAVELNRHTLKFPAATLGETAEEVFAARERLTRGVGQAGLAQASVSVPGSQGLQVTTVTPRPISQELGGAYVSSTPDARAWWIEWLGPKKGLTVTEQRLPSGQVKPPQEQGVFAVPGGSATRFSEKAASAAPRQFAAKELETLADALGGASKEPIRAINVFADAGLNRKAVDTRKFYPSRSTVEFEAKYPVGTDIPPPSQTLRVRDVNGEWVQLNIIGGKLSPAQIVKLKLVGNAQAFKDLFASPVNRRATAAMNAAIDAADDVLVARSAVNGAKNARSVNALRREADSLRRSLDTTRAQIGAARAAGKLLDAARRELDAADVGRRLELAERRLVAAERAREQGRAALPELERSLRDALGVFERRLETARALAVADIRLERVGLYAGREDIGRELARAGIADTRPIRTAAELRDEATLPRADAPDAGRGDTPRAPDGPDSPRIATPTRTPPESPRLPPEMATPRQPEPPRQGTPRVGPPIAPTPRTPPPPPRVPDEPGGRIVLPPVPSGKDSPTPEPDKKRRLDNILVVGVHQGLWEPAVNLETGEVTYYADLKQVPNIPDARESFTVLKRGPGDPKTRIVDMGVVDAVFRPVEKGGVNYVADHGARKRGNARAKAKRQTKKQARQQRKAALQATTMRG